MPGHVRVVALQRLGERAHRQRLVGLEVASSAIACWKDSPSSEKTAIRRGLSALKMRQNRPHASCGGAEVLRRWHAANSYMRRYLTQPNIALASPTMTHDNGIEVEGLVREFKNGPRAVDGIDLRVEPGEIYGFLGPNGAGKSTTVLMLTTLLPPTAGTARVAGHDIVREGAGRARRDRRRAAGGRAGPAADRPRAHEAADHAAGRAQGRAPAARRRADRARRARRRGRPQGRRLLRRHEAPAGPRAGARAPAADPLPRRADHGPGPLQPRGHVEGGLAPGPRRGRDRLPHHAVPRGGRRAGRPDRDHRPRPDRRPRHAGGAQGRDRAPDARGHAGRAGRPRHGRGRAGALRQRRARAARARPPCG